MHGSFNQCLTVIFEKLFTTGYCLRTWSEGFIVQLHKKRIVNKHENYRGIKLSESYISMGSKSLKQLNNVQYIT